MSAGARQCACACAFSLGKTARPCVRHGRARARAFHSGSQARPRADQGRPRADQEPPKRGPRTAKSGPGTPKISPRKAKSGPRATQSGPGAPKSGLRAAKSGPKCRRASREQPKPKSGKKTRRRLPHWHHEAQERQRSLKFQDPKRTVSTNGKELERRGAGQEIDR